MTFFDVLQPATCIFRTFARIKYYAKMQKTIKIITVLSNAISLSFHIIISRIAPLPPKKKQTNTKEENDPAQKKTQIVTDVPPVL